MAAKSKYSIKWKFFDAPLRIFVIQISFFSLQDKTLKVSISFVLKSHKAQVMYDHNRIVGKNDGISGWSALVDIKILALQLPRRLDKTIIAFLMVFTDIKHYFN